MNMTDYMDFVYGQIEAAVIQAQKELRRGVLPRDVQPRLPYNRAEGSLRRDMLAMYKYGRLVRVGGAGARRGYRLPTRMERLSFTINAGIFPLGTERIVLWAK
jgi:hypothetical protein